MSKFILQTYFDFNDNKKKFLRFINRETPSYYVSEAQRFINFSNKLYYFEPKFSHKFKKTSKSYKLLNNLNFFKELNCKLDYDLLFNSDTSILFDDNPEVLKHYNFLGNNTKIKYSYGFDIPLKSASDKEIVKYLKDLFQVKTVIYFDNFLYDPSGSDVLNLTSTLYHITHFNNDIAQIDYSLNEANTSIAFWLFDDKLVFSKIIGIDTF